MRLAVAGVDPEQPVANIRSMQQIIDGELSTRTVQTTLVGCFAGLALLLSSVGLYAVLSYDVAQRTPEIGLRMALGARRVQVVAFVVARTLRSVIVGVALGWVAALASARLLGTLLFGVAPTDPVTFALIPLLLAAVALLACWIPSRRAAGVDPLVALGTD